MWLSSHWIGDDLVFFLGGGERAHVGAVVIAEPGKKIMTIKLSGHYDHVVLKPIAEAACQKYKTKVIAIGGVHVDYASKEEIRILVDNCAQLLPKI
ncbi:MAG TPA: hypothetical protein VMT57_09130 [Candidatus Thermoplasmatota archaeon]|nr:hypothetical protein [Candidatus Thermoplasmatota archaeon]